jgi:protein phosphatase
MTEETVATGAVSHDPIVVRAVLRSDVGLVRSENQDFGTCTTSKEERSSPAGGRLFIVADGMGGHRGGATASRLAAETMKAQYLGSETDDIAAALREALARANARVFTEAQANPDLRGMGTTTSALAVKDGLAWFAHVGDSRIYLIREDAISQLTDDHSLVASMVREGLLTTTEAENHPRRNVLQRSIGVAEDVEIDVKGPIELRPGDTFVLCSDGLHGVVKQDEMREIGRKPLRDAADEFVRLALERGAPDNVTVIVARAERASEAGEETVFDKSLEDTQEILVPALDETVRDEPLPVEESARGEMMDSGQPHANAEVPAASPAPAPEAPAASAPAAAQTPKESAAARPAPDRHPFMKWMLIVVIVLGVAGAWFYWAR